MKTAVIYARHLTYRKNEPNIDEQIKNCTEFAGENDFKITDCYTECFDEKKLIYPVFEQLKKQCKRKNAAKNFEAIIIHSRLALGRKNGRIFDWVNSLYKKGIEVYFVTDEKSEYGQVLRLLVEGYRRRF